jgi:SMC interacting uncharacterized protein involved in chromosome segregation
VYDDILGDKNIKIKKPNKKNILKAMRDNIKGKEQIIKQLLDKITELERQIESLIDL